MAWGPMGPGLAAQILGNHAARLERTGAAPVLAQAIRVVLAQRRRLLTERHQGDVG